MRKILSMIAVLLMCSFVFAAERPEAEISVGVGYGLQSMGTSVHGPAIDFYGASTWDNNISFFCWDAFEFPLSASAGGVTLERSYFDMLFGMDILCGAAYTFGRNSAWSFTLGGGLYLGWIWAVGGGSTGMDTLLGLGAMARAKYNINESWYLSAGLKASFIFLDFARANGNSATITGQGSSIYAALSAGMRF